MLADDPGLGKTPQAALAAVMPAIVSCPKYLVGQWEQWILTYMPDRTVQACRGDRFRKSGQIKADVDFVIINQEMLRTHFKELAERNKARPWKTLIIDESHHLKNKDAIRSKNAAKLARTIEYVFELTATPIWKEVDDLWMQLHILHPDIFPSYNYFVDTYCIADQTRFGPKILGVKKEMLPELEEMLSHVKLGRTYAQAGRELPPLIEKTVTFDLNPAIRKIYNQTKSYWIEEIDQGYANYASVLHALRQITGCAAKAETVAELLEDVKGQALIFVWYRDQAEMIHQALPGSVVITGAMPEKQRQLVAKTAGGHVIATISALCEGIDLSHMRTVVFAEEHWPPGANHQALSRVRRERQEDSNEEPVVAYYVHAKDTVDERIHLVTQTRQATIRDVLGLEGILND